MVAIATSLKCNVSAKSVFCRPTTQTPLHNQLSSRCHSHKASYSKFSPKIVAMATSSAPLDYHRARFLGPIRAHNPNRISSGSAVFAPLTAECPNTLQWDALFPPQNCPYPWGIWTPSNTWFLGSSRVLNSNGISIVQAVFAGLTIMTDRHDRPRYSVGNDRPHLRT